MKASDLNHAFAIAVYMSRIWLDLRRLPQFAISALLISKNLNRKCSLIATTMFVPKRVINSPGTFITRAPAK